MRDAMGLLGIAALAVVTMLNIGLYVRLFRARCRGAAFVGLLAKCAALALAALLLYAIFFREDDGGPDEEVQESPPVLVVQDKSLSMSLLAGEKTRDTLAEEVREALEAEVTAGLASENRELGRLLFAANVTTPADAGTLVRDQTLGAKALPAALNRLEHGILLVLSDGAFTDGPPSPFLLRTARNRGIPIYTVCCVEQAENLIDVRVDALELDPVNPERVTAIVSLIGNVEGDVPVRLLVDGEFVSSRTCPVSERVPVVFDIPQVEPGWHELEVTIPKFPGEICPENNVKRGVFKVLPGDRILFVHGRPSQEQSVLYRFLRKIAEDRLDAVPARDAAGKHVDAADYRLAVVGDVAPDALSPSVLALVESPRVPSLFIGGNHLQAWGARRSRGFPVYRVEYMPAPETARVTVAESALPPFSPLRKLSEAPLTLKIVPNCVAAEGAVVLARAEHSGRATPVLMADNTERPNYVVSLPVTTWRWSMSPEPKVRDGYVVLWGSLCEWLMQPPGEGAGLDLEVEWTADREDQAMLVATLRDHLPAIEPDRVSVTVERGETSEEIVLEKADGPSFRGTCEYRDPGTVVWVRARAAHGDVMLRSERRPLFRDSREEELQDVRPRPANLERLATDGKERFAFYPDYRELLQKLLGEQTAPPAPHRTSRDPGQEMLLAILLFLALAIDWFIERRHKNDL